MACLVATPLTQPCGEVLGELALATPDGVDRADLHQQRGVGMDILRTQRAVGHQAPALDWSNGVEPPRAFLAEKPLPRAISARRCT